VGRVEARRRDGEGKENHQKHTDEHHHLPPQRSGVPFPDPLQPGRGFPVQEGEPDREAQGKATDENLQDDEQGKSLSPRVVRTFD